MFSELMKEPVPFCREKRHIGSSDIKPLKLRLNAVGLQCFALSSKLECVV